jgi:hypothetical protein
VEPAGLRTPIIMLRHTARTRAKQILSPCVIVLQVALARMVVSKMVKNGFKSFSGVRVASRRLNCKWK